MLCSLLCLTKVLLETVEARFPEPPVVLDPTADLPERGGPQSAGPPLGGASPGDQAGLFQHLEVFRDGLEADGERLGKLVLTVASPSAS
jgi:hypothetical protein